MRINPNPGLPEEQPTDRVGGAASTTQGSSTQTARTASQAITDQANLSSDAQQLSSLSVTLSSFPDVRSSRVAAVMQAMQNGNHVVSDQQIAQSMMRDFTMDGSPNK